MSKKGWVTDSQALLTIMGLRALQIGDELKFVRRSNGEKERCVVEKDACSVKYIDPEFAYRYYSKLRGKDEKEDWTLTGWRRPIAHK